ncbi:RnfABCDGE type electron transport complex subunit D [Arsenophonus endosymbiont of Aleurodicus floccissimus]|uniref:RnfABCDGE type electron transport complex subunit D n=1 Tax=Arsenophonus endosymbiont of Aleurodicus floccissimus TaxID=2152761 RepID=UPI003F72D811
MTPEAGWVSKILLGSVYFLPIYMVVFLVGGFWEVLFLLLRGHEINEGFFVSSICPYCAAYYTNLAGGIRYYVWYCCGERNFWCTGRNFLNPALAGRAFLFFAYPAQISGDLVWTGIRWLLWRYAIITMG